jgi:hypothetical protein
MLEANRIILDTLEARHDGVVEDSDVSGKSWWSRARASSRARCAVRPSSAGAP